MGSDYLLMPVWRSIRDGLTGKGESDVRVVRAGTRQPGNLHGSKMSYLPWLISSRLLTPKSQSMMGASCQPAFMGSCLTICQTCLPCAHLLDGCSCSPGLGRKDKETVKFGTQL